MNPLQHGKENIDEAFPTEQPSFLDNVTEIPFSGASKDDLSNHASSKFKTKITLSVDASKHASLERTARSSIPHDKTKANHGTPFEQNSLNQEKNVSALTASNGPSPKPTDGSMPDGKTENSGDDIDHNTYPEGGLRAWSVVLGSFSGMTASFGILNIAGTFQAYVSTHELAHESPSTVGWIFSLFAFLTFFCGVQIGPIFDAKGPRWLVAAGTLFLVAGMMGVAESTSMSIILLTNMSSSRQLGLSVTRYFR